MPLWFVFLVVTLTLFGSAIWMTASGSAAASETNTKNVLSEPAAWRTLVGPAVVGGLFFAFMVGWALQETNPADELVPTSLAVPATVVGAVVLRALVRAVRSALAAPTAATPIATVGLIRARAVVSDAFRERASPEVLAAALAHEAAHIRGRDPLRIWIAQFIADLQWPIPKAQLRLHRWALALELRRDDEANPQRRLGNRPCGGPDHCGRTHCRRFFRAIDGQRGRHFGRGPGRRSRRRTRAARTTSSR